MICLGTSNAMKAKKYLRNICCKSEFDKFIKDIIFNQTESIVIIDQFRDNKSISSIAMKLNLSESTLRKYQHSALSKIYKFMDIKGIIE